MRLLFLRSITGTAVCDTIVIDIIYGSYFRLIAVSINFTLLSTSRPLRASKGTILFSGVNSSPHWADSRPSLFHYPEPCVLGFLVSRMEKPTTPPPIGNADRSGGLLGTSILALSSVLIFIGLRFATRIWLVKRVGWDDWCIVFAGVSLLLREQSG